MREYTNKITEMIEDGLLTPNTVLQEILQYLDESIIEDFCKNNDMFGDMFGEFDEDENE